MLSEMTSADADPPRADSSPPHAGTVDAAGSSLALPRGCPFLLAEPGGWRLDEPTREHRCSAFSPPSPLAPEKQARLCLTEAHTGCATYLASVAAREARLGAPPRDRITRWGLARTTAIIEDAGGVRARVLAAALDRRRWPAIPAVLLVTALFTLALSGFRAGIPSNPVATSSPAAPSAPATSPGASAVASSPPPGASALPSTGPVTPTSPSTPAPATPAPATPEATFRTYVVQSGDTLSAIAAEFGTTVEALTALNGITDPGSLSIGQVLLIPD